MAVFRDSEQFYECVGALMDLAKKDPQVGGKIAKSNIVIRFQYKNPDAVTTVDARSTPTQEGAFVDVFHGKSDLVAEVVMSMDADIAHRFWLGKVNLVSALTKGEIQAVGPISKILKLLPAVKPLYKQYPILLREKGYENLLTRDL